ncbi:MAG TPA: ASCH domain-containing protein [Micromonospora sp.]|jgi:predicted transcriptional regulator|nr:ASCH domain-containing protein [Micromonospora sp.]
MSIHPEYARAILAGTKTVEFRKRRLADDVTHVLVYATAPVGKLVGAFTVAGQDTVAPTTLWRRFAAVAGIPRAKFFAYFATARQGTGIRVGSVLAPPAPLNLCDTLGVARPPQSFQYVPQENAAAVLTAMSPS